MTFDAQKPAADDGPAALSTLHLGDDIAVVRGALPLPGLGRIPVNAFVLGGREPMLIDTGVAALREPTLAAIGAEIDLAALRWIFISHADADHTGNLPQILEAAPNARVLIGFLGLAKMMLTGQPVDRMQVIAPGEELAIGDRRIRVMRPPYYDAPETLGFHEAASGTLFAVDAFGAVLPSVTSHAEELDPGALDRGLATWSALDAPWLVTVDRTLLRRQLTLLDALAPRHVLSAHLPPASDVRLLTSRVARIREAADNPLDLAA